ncbi:dual specificity protein phosphatase 16-like [Arapaima gigas]
MVFYREQNDSHPPLSLILPQLYLGAESDVTQDCLSSQGISYVLSVSRCCPQPDFLPQKQYLRIPIDDSLRDDLLPWIPEALQFIDGAMSLGCSVLVHCAAGVSRSPALAVAYVMYRLGLGLDDAYRFVKERRPSISPNFNFLGQLQFFQGTLGHKGCGAKQNVEVAASVGDHLHSTNGNTGQSSASQNTPVQHHAEDDCGSSRGCCDSVQGDWHQESLSHRRDNLNMSSKQSNGSPAVTTDLKHAEVDVAKLTVSFSDSMRMLSVTRPPQQPNSSSVALDQNQNMVPRPTHLHLSLGHMSLSEKRKHLTLSLSPLGFGSQKHAGHQRNAAKAAQLRDSSSPQTKIRPNNPQAESAPFRELPAKHGMVDCWDTTPLWSQPKDAKSSKFNPGEPAEHKHASRAQQERAVEAIEAVEGLDVGRTPSSPAGVSVNKLLGWGEKLLLGALLSPRIKLGQAALQYRC